MKNSQISRKFCSFTYRMPLGHQTHLTKMDGTSPWHIIIKTTSTENRERILKAMKEKKQHMKVDP
jgi:hypothetical protein